MEPIFFRTPEELRAWFVEHHLAADELWVGMWKKGSGEAGVTWREAVGEALCVGWIDSVVRRIDDRSHMQRFTPRRPRSRWSTVNVARVAELTAQGRMLPAGTAAFEARTAARTGTYSHEQEDEPELGPEQAARLRADPAAEAFLAAQPRWYRRAVVWWVVSAARDETRERRLAQLVAESSAGRTIRRFTRPARRDTAP